MGLVSIVLCNETTHTQKRKQTIETPISDSRSDVLCVLSELVIVFA